MPARARGGDRGAPQGARHRGRRHHHLARAPAPRRRARPRRRQPAGRRPRRRPPSRSSTRTGCWSSPTATRSPTGPSVGFAELADHELLLEPSGTAFRDELDREAAAAGIELRAEGRGRRPAAHRHAGLPGVRRRHRARHRRARLARGRAGDACRSTAWRGARVGLARRRGPAVGPGRALRETVIEVVATEGPGTEGVHPAT